MPARSDCCSIALAKHRARRSRAIRGHPAAARCPGERHRLSSRGKFDVVTTSFVAPGDHAGRAGGGLALAAAPATAANGGTDALWLTAGINHEQNGLLGVLRPLI